MSSTATLGSLCFTARDIYCNTTKFAFYCMCHLLQHYEVCVLLQVSSTATLGSLCFTACVIYCNTTKFVFYCMCHLLQNYEVCVLLHVSSTATPGSLCFTRKVLLRISYHYQIKQYLHNQEGPFDILQENYSWFFLWAARISVVAVVYGIHTSESTSSLMWSIALTRACVKSYSIAGTSLALIVTNS